MPWQEQKYILTALAWFTYGGPPLTPYTNILAMSERLFCALKSAIQVVKTAKLFGSVLIVREKKDEHLQSKSHYFIFTTFFLNILMEL